MKIKCPYRFVDLPIYLENDAPCHFHSTMDASLGERKPSITIDEVPLDWCFQSGVKLDFPHFADGYLAIFDDAEVSA